MLLFFSSSQMPTKTTMQRGQKRLKAVLQLQYNSHCTKHTLFNAFTLSSNCNTDRHCTKHSDLDTFALSFNSTFLSATDRHCTKYTHNNGFTLSFNSNTDSAKQSNLNASTLSFNSTVLSATQRQAVQSQHLHPQLQQHRPFSYRHCTKYTHYNGFTLSFNKHCTKHSTLDTFIFKYIYFLFYFIL